MMTLPVTEMISLLLTPNLVNIKVKVDKGAKYSSLKLAHRYINSRAVWDHGVTCHPPEVKLPP